MPVDVKKIREEETRYKIKEEKKNKEYYDYLETLRPRIIEFLRKKKGKAYSSEEIHRNLRGFFGKRILTDRTFSYYTFKIIQDHVPNVHMIRKGITRYYYYIEE